MNGNLLNQVEENEANSYLIDDGALESYFCTNSQPQENPYRLYRLLTELEDTIANYQNEAEIIKILIPKVRQLLIESDWIQFEYTIPDPDLGWSVNTLYDEPNFPLTIQMVTWLPGQISPIHNHGTWGIVAIISGSEKNVFWQKDATSSRGNAIDVVAPSIIAPIKEKVLEAGDIIGFTRDVIHQVEVVSDQPVVSFNLYGITDYDQRYEFDPVSQVATNF